MKSQDVILTYEYDVTGDFDYEPVFGGKFELEDWSTKGIVASFVCKSTFDESTNSEYFKGVYFRVMSISGRLKKLEILLLLLLLPKSM